MHLRGEGPRSGPRVNRSEMAPPSRVISSRPERVEPAAPPQHSRGSGQLIILAFSMSYAGTGVRSAFE